MNRKFLSALTLGCIGVMACAQPKELKFHEDEASVSYNSQILIWTRAHLKDMRRRKRHFRESAALSVRKSLTLSYLRATLLPDLLQKRCGNV